MDKKSLRKWAKELRANLDMEKISSLLALKLQSSEEYKNAKNIMLFYPMKDEVDLRCILKDSSKNFYLPKIEGENLLCCPYKDGDETCLSCFNTCEPLSEPCPKERVDIVIIPALACDKNGHRLGYGGGFYDRFLKDFEGNKIVCIPKELIVKTVFPQKYDIKIDIIITT